MPELQFLKTLIFPRALLNLQNWVFFFLLKIFLSPLLKKWSLLLALNLIKQRTEENKETKVNKNIEKTSA